MINPIVGKLNFTWVYVNYFISISLLALLLSKKGKELRFRDICESVNRSLALTS
jgi:hypothetical protein